MDAPIMIYDRDRNFITETVVTGYGKDEMYIEVSEGLENVAPGTRLRLLVIHADSVSELGGSLKSVRQGIYEISIYGQRRRDARTSARYAYSIPAMIKDLLVETEIVTLVDPISVTIVNLSSTGLLLKSPDMPLVEGIFLKIEFKLRDRNTIINCKVVREPNEDNDPDCFGCRIIFPK
jgi:hypothetical protein